MDELVIKFKLKHIERLIFLLIIIGLSGVVFWQNSIISGNNQVTGNVIAEEIIPEPIELEPVIEKEPEKVIEEPVVEEEPAIKEIVVATPKPIIDNTPKVVAGRRVFTISNIKTTIKGENWAKLDEFKLKVENGLKDLTLKYNVFIYNIGSQPRDTPDQTVELSTIKSGTIYEKTQNWGGESFSDITQNKKLKIVFYDSGNNEIETKIIDFKAS